MAHDAQPVADTKNVEADLVALATRLRDRQPLTAAQRVEIANVLQRVSGARRAWDQYGERHPDDTTTDRAHHMRGVLAFVLDRSVSDWEAGA